MNICFRSFRYPRVDAVCIWSRMALENRHSITNNPEPRYAASLTHDSRVSIANKDAKDPSMPPLRKLPIFPFNKQPPKSP